MPEEIDETSLTAYALDELDGADHAIQRAELEARLASDHSLRRQVEEIRATAQWVSAELAAETTLGLTEIQHAAIERRLEHAGQPDSPPLQLRPIRLNWAFWGSLAASIVIVCTVMASVLPKLYRIGYVRHGDGSGGEPPPASGPAPFILESPSVASPTSPGLPLRKSVHPTAAGSRMPRPRSNGERVPSSRWRIRRSPACRRCRPIRTMPSSWLPSSDLWITIGCRRPMSCGPMKSSIPCPITTQRRLAMKRSAQPSSWPAVPGIRPTGFSGSACAQPTRRQPPGLTHRPLRRTAEFPV